jgi:hypothetical protein
MRESPLGFEYTWADLQPIRTLAGTVFGAQVVGAVLGLLFAHHAEWFFRLWFGGAVATFPAFVVGALLQSRVAPGSIVGNRVMVRRFGLIAAVLSLAAFFVPALSVE